MNPPPTPAEANFRKAAPDALYQTLLGMLELNYRKAYKASLGGDYREGAGLTLLPQMRRALMESEMPGVAHSLKLNFHIIRFPGNRDDFVLIEMPGGVELIVCYVKDADAPVRYARKREELAQQSNMPYLEFLDFEPGRLVLPPAGLFSILTHSPDERDLGRLGEANIIFPSPNPLYSLGSLNLHREAERVHREQAAAALQTQRKVEVKLKKGGTKS